MTRQLTVSSTRTVQHWLTPAGSSQSTGRVAVDWGRRARETLEQAGDRVIYRESLIPHTVDPGFLDELGPWATYTLGLST